MKKSINGEQEKLKETQSIMRMIGRHLPVMLITPQRRILTYTAMFV